MRSKELLAATMALGVLNMRADRPRDFTKRYPTKVRPKDNPAGTKLLRAAEKMRLGCWSARQENYMRHIPKLPTLSEEAQNAAFITKWEATMPRLLDLAKREAEFLRKKQEVYVAAGFNHDQAFTLITRKQRIVMAMSETDAKLIELLERVAKSEAYKNGAWQKVIAEAKNYAMMKLNGTCLEQHNGGDCIMHIGRSDQDMYIKLFTSNILAYSLEAFAESALT